MFMQFMNTKKKIYVDNIWKSPKHHCKSSDLLIGVIIDELGVEVEITIDLQFFDIGVRVLELDMNEKMYLMNRKHPEK